MSGTHCVGVQPGQTRASSSTHLLPRPLLQLPSWKHRLCFRHPGHLPCVSVLVSQMFACWHCPAELAVDVLVDAPHEPCRRCKANYTYSTARGKCIEDCGVGAQAQYPAAYDLVRSPRSTSWPCCCHGIILSARMSDSQHAVLCRCAHPAAHPRCPSASAPRPVATPLAPEPR